MGIIIKFHLIFRGPSKMGIIIKFHLIFRDPSKMGIIIKFHKYFYELLIFTNIRIRVHLYLFVVGRINFLKAFSIQSD